MYRGGSPTGQRRNGELNADLLLAESLFLMNYFRKKVRLKDGPICLGVIRCHTNPHDRGHLACTRPRLRLFS